MWISDKWQDFELIDCSKGEKLERWGKFYLVRPDPQAIWDTPRSDARWNMRDARYRRSQTGGGAWDKGGLPASWKINYGELTFNVKPMNFKHTGLFPEQACNWDYAMRKIRSAGRPINVLNLLRTRVRQQWPAQRQVQACAMLTRQRAWSHGAGKTLPPPASAMRRYAG